MVGPRRPAGTGRRRGSPPASSAARPAAHSASWLRLMDAGVGNPRQGHRAVPEHTGAPRGQGGGSSSSRQVTPAGPLPPPASSPPPPPRARGACPSWFQGTVGFLAGSALWPATQGWLARGSRRSSRPCTPDQRPALRVSPSPSARAPSAAVCAAFRRPTRLSATLLAEMRRRWAAGCQHDRLSEPGSPAMPPWWPGAFRGPGGGASPRTVPSQQPRQDVWLWPGAPACPPPLPAAAVGAGLADG